MKRRYRIADNTIEIASQRENDVWTKLEPNYEPFAAAESDDRPEVAVELQEGPLPQLADEDLIYQDIPAEPDMLKLYVYRDTESNLCFKIIQPRDTEPRVALKLSPDYKAATVYIEEKGIAERSWQIYASLTGALQLAYYFGTYHNGTLLSHASSVLKDGKAYLFLGKSGTGKSTHSRMWMSAFADAVLLNDDHPIIKVDAEGAATAYGSPWSGKTPCYKNLSAPIGAIVRIRRAPSNSLRRLSPLEAYASVMPSMFNAPFDRHFTDTRHQSLEKLISSVPCYDMHCLPDVEAAQVCYEGVSNNKK